MRKISKRKASTPGITKKYLSKQGIKDICLSNSEEKISGYNTMVVKIRIDPEEGTEEDIPDEKMEFVS